MRDTFIIDQANSFYKRALKREIGNWQNFEQENFIFEEFHKIDFIFNSKNFSFNKNKDWVDFFAGLGPFKNALILGGNNTNLEKYLLGIKNVENIENLDIIFRNDSSSQTTRFSDLNFIELPENKYDLIIAKSILHHIINLEHLILQVNKALTQKGIVVVFEYVGETKQQWDINKIDIINNEFTCEDILPGYKFEKLKSNYYNDFPFESIRSSEVTKILHSVFNDKVFEIEWGKLIWPIDYHIKMYCRDHGIILDDEKKAIINTRAMRVDELYKNDLNLLPSYIFGIYKKNNNFKTPEIQKWSKSKIEKELILRGPLRIRVLSFFTTHRNNKIIKFLSNLKNKLKIRI
jgi:hypothetical protein